MQLPEDFNYLAFINNITFIDKVKNRYGLKNSLSIPENQTALWLSEIGHYLKLRKSEAIVITKTRTRNKTLI